MQELRSLEPSTLGAPTRRPFGADNRSAPRRRFVGSTCSHRAVSWSSTCCCRRSRIPQRRSRASADDALEVRTGNRRQLNIDQGRRGDAQGRGVHPSRRRGAALGSARSETLRSRGSTKGGRRVARSEAIANTVPHGRGRDPGCGFQGFQGGRVVHASQRRGEADGAAASRRQVRPRGCRELPGR